jgi:hypothetical protein
MGHGILNSALVLALVAAFPSLLLGYLAYKRAQKVDAIAEQAGIATVESGTIGQVIDGLNRLIANLQTDNEVLRNALAYCEKLRERGSRI